MSPAPAETQSLSAETSDPRVRALSPSVSAETAPLNPRPKLLRAFSEVHRERRFRGRKTGVSSAPATRRHYISAGGHRSYPRLTPVPRPPDDKARLQNFHHWRRRKKDPVARQSSWKNMLELSQVRCDGRGTTFSRLQTSLACVGSCSSALRRCHVS